MPALMRALRNWLSFGRWTTCEHPLRTIRVVRKAFMDPVLPRPMGEVWLLCRTCSVILRRRAETSDDAAWEEEDL
jgi:hypothetical protein